MAAAGSHPSPVSSHGGQCLSDTTRGRFKVFLQLVEKSLYIVPFVQSVSQLFAGSHLDGVSSIPSFLPFERGGALSPRPARLVAPSSSFLGRPRRRWENGSVQLAVTLVSFATAAAAAAAGAVVIQGAAVIYFEEAPRRFKRAECVASCEHVVDPIMGVPGSRPTGRRPPRPAGAGT